jgi:hypothetical protein
MTRESEILASAKAVMDNFFTSLSSRSVELQTVGLARKTQVRDAVVRLEGNDAFKFKILENAPLKNQDYILAEKKSW